MKFDNMYGLVFEEKQLLMEVPHIALPLAYTIDKKENYFDAKFEKLMDNIYANTFDIVEHFVKRFIKRKLNKTQREAVYNDSALNAMMKNRFSKDFDSPYDKRGTLTIKDRIEFMLEDIYGE